jgi:ATP-dependent DNA helicase DinG
LIAFPALAATHAGVWIAMPDGPAVAVGRGEAIRRAADTPHILLNAPVIASRLG